MEIDENEMMVTIVQSESDFGIPSELEKYAIANAHVIENELPAHPKVTVQNCTGIVFFDHDTSRASVEFSRMIRKLNIEEKYPSYQYHHFPAYMRHFMYIEQECVDDGIFREHLHFNALSYWNSLATTLSDSEIVIKMKRFFDAVSACEEEVRNIDL